MKKFVFAVVVYIVHRPTARLKFGQDCLECAKFKDNKTKYSLELRRNLAYGMCDKHLTIFKKVMDLDKKLHQLLEYVLGLEFEDGDLNRYLPNGTHCTMRSISWGEYLIQLAEEKK